MASFKRQGTFNTTCPWDFVKTSIIGSNMEKTGYINIQLQVKGNDHSFDADEQMPLL